MSLLGVASKSVGAETSVEILNETDVDKIYGCVIIVVDGNQDLHLKWDLDYEILKSVLIRSYINYQSLPFKQI